MCPRQPYEHEHEDWPRPDGCRIFRLALSYVRQFCHCNFSFKSKIPLSHFCYITVGVCLKRPMPESDSVNDEANAEELPCPQMSVGCKWDNARDDARSCTIEFCRVIVPRDSAFVDRIPQSRKSSNHAVYFYSFHETLHGRRSWWRKC